MGTGALNLAIALLIIMHAHPILGDDTYYATPHGNKYYSGFGKMFRKMR